jgi:hypothetical protein
MKIEDITTEQFEMAIKRYAYSININPQMNGLCVYDAGNGRHCLIGQVLIDLGVALGEYEEIHDNVAAVSLPWRDAELTQLSSRYQTAADNEHGPPREWRTAIAMA